MSYATLDSKAINKSLSSYRAANAINGKVSSEANAQAVKEAAKELGKKAEVIS